MLAAGLAAILVILAIPAYGYIATFVLPPRQWVVQVNDESYNMGYLLKLLRMFQRGSQAGGGGVNLGTLPFELVNTLAENELIRQGAPRYRVTVSQQEIDAEVRQRFLSTATGQQTPPDQLQREFQERYRQYLNLVQVSEEEHRQIVTNELYREKMRNQLGLQVNRVQPQVRLFNILIPASDRAQVLADEVRTEFARGTPLEQLVARRDLNLDPEVVRKGGEVGWIPEGILPDLDKLLFTELQVGKLSEPIPQVEPGGGGTSYTMYLVREKSEAREVEDRHFETLKTRALQDWLREERKPPNEVRIAFDSERYEWLLKQLRLSGTRSPGAQGSGQ